MKPLFTVPKIVKFDDLAKSWYVYFRYGPKNNRKLFRYSCDINRIHNYKKRLFEAEALQKALHDELKSGWNPLIPELYSIEHEGMTVIEALDFAMEKKSFNLSKKSIADYNCTNRFIADAIINLNIRHLEITELKRVHIKTILEHIQKSRKWSANAYNKNLGILQAILSELIQWDIIENNPAHKIKPQHYVQAVAHVPANEQQLIDIRNTLLTKQASFFLFVLVIYHTGMRPVEITRLTISMIDRRLRQFVLPAEITKNKRQRIIPIAEQLWRLLEPILDTEHPQHYYLFGTTRESGRGNIGLHRDFIPGPTQIRRDTPTNRWKKLVIEGLGFDCSLYSMKKAGANAKIKAGMSRRALQEVFGHSSEVTTEIYITKNLLHQEIMQKSLDF